MNSLLPSYGTQNLIEMARKNIRTHRNDLFLAHVNCAGSGLFVVVPGGAYPRKPTTPATWGERCTTPRRTGQPTWRLIFMNPGTTRDKSMGKTIGKRTVLMVLGGRAAVHASTAWAADFCRAF